MTDAEDIDARYAEKMRRRKAAKDRLLAAKTADNGLIIVHDGAGVKAQKGVEY